MNDNITNWLKKEKSLLKDEYSGYGYIDEVLIRKIKQEEKRLEDFVEKIISTIELKDVSDVEFLFPYFENLSSNKRVAFIFREHAKIATGSTNKDGIKAFRKCFGSEVVNNILLNRKKVEDLAKKREQDEKDIALNKKIKEEEEYFSNVIWDKQKISQLTPMQKGRLKKALNKEYNYSSKILSVINYLSTLNILGKEITSKMCQWNRRKYNNMSSTHEQNEYEEKLKAGRLYRVNLEDDYIYQIPKIIYDVLDVKIIQSTTLD